MHRKFKKALASVLTAVMLIGLVPVNTVPVHAEETTVAETGLVWDLSTVGVLASTDNFAVGEFNVIASSEVKVAEVTDVMSDSGEAFAWKLALGGSGNSTKRAVSFTVPSASTVTVYSRSTGDGDRTLAVADKDGKVLTNMTAVGKANTVLSGTTVELAAGTYYIYSTGSGIDIYDIIVKTNINLDVSGVTATKYTENVVVGDFEILATSAKDIEILDISSSPVTSDDGKTFNTAVKLGGGGALTYRAVKFTVPVTSDINFYGTGSGDSARTFVVADVDGKQVTTFDVTAKSSVVAAQKVTLEAGTYYVYSKSSGVLVYGICAAPDEPELTPWADVPTPSITGATTDAEGNIVVDFNASIDKYAGAEKVTVVMLKDGFEFTSAEVKVGSVTSVTFTPIWSGDYSFKIVAHRTGEADKVSADFAYAGYVLPVKKPIVEMSQNRGNGVVYLDWINVEAADTYNVSYRVAGTEAYTSFVTGSNDAHAEITGLTAGTAYDFKIDAVRTSDNFTATYEMTNFMVTAEAEQLWYFGTVGSAQETHATVANADGSVAQQVDMATKDETENKVGITPAAVDIVNTDKSVTFASTGNGKISDGEEGFQYFYTMIDPNTQNFELTATFELVELWGGAFDNQTGYGIIATDMLGYNYYGTDGLWIKHKQLNSVSTQIYSNKANFVGQRNISGYVSSDATSVDDVTRVTEETKFKNTAPNYNIGATYTFTLKKTNDGFISVCNGEEIKYDNLAITSVQEDGSLCIGVFASRNAGVKITDIKFSTSESTGVVAVEKSDEITPSVAILSSGTSNSDTYELVYHPNIAGKLTVADNAGKVVYEGDVKALDVVRVKVPVTLGKNTITSTLVPDASQKLTSYNNIVKTTSVEYQVLENNNGVIYVGPEGTSAGNGTKENPYDLATVVKYAQPGQYIVLLNGEYTCNNITIGRSVSGTAEKHISLVAEETGKVRFKNFGLTVVGDYWDIYGVYVYYPGNVGIQISGNYNTIEMCTVEGSANTGIQISRSGSVDREAGLANLLWPSYNLVKNCESFDNCDAGRNDADGFAAKLTSGEGNVFYGCIAHNNIDDGWDLFAKAISGEIGAVTIENCVAYNNGWMTYEDTTAAGYKYGEGNGFKLGGNDMYGGHKLINSVAYGNIGKGITSNSCPDCEVYNSTSYGNAVGESAAYNISLATKTSNQQRWVVKGLISLTSNTKTADQIPFSFRTADNYIYDGAASYNNQAVYATDAWFTNVDVSIVPTRNADGTINMQGLLVPTDACPADAGARIDTTSDAAKSTAPVMPELNPDEPSDEPSDTPSENPSETPSEEPTETPSEEPSETPSEEPSETPSEEPSETPSEEPSEAPSEEPSEAPSEEPTEAPSEEPTQAPSEEPTQAPTEAPTQAPIVSTDKPVANVTINQQVDSDNIDSALNNVASGEALKVTVNKSEVAVEPEVFKAAAEKDVELIFDCGRYAWKFTDLSADNAVEVKSLNVDINANVPAVEDVLTGAGVTAEARRTVSFAHDGELPGKAEVTLEVAEKFSNGKELFLYYFNEVSKGFEFISKNVVADGKVTITLTHCSDYVLSENELPAAVVIATSTSTGSNAGLDVETGDNSPIVLMVVLAVLSLAGLAGYMVYDKKKKAKN